MLRDLDKSSHAEKLFEKPRLEARFRVFRSVCLPSLMAQPESEFSAIILSSRDLPDVYKEELVKCCAKRKNIHVEFKAPKPYSTAFSESIGELYPGLGAAATVRLDDDDALSEDFTDRMSRYVEQRFLNMCVTFPVGLECSEKERGQVVFWRKHWLNGSAGLSFISENPSDKNIYHCGNHSKVSDSFPTIVDTSSVFYFQTLHAHNDSVRRQSSNITPLSKIHELFPRKFGFLDASSLVSALAE